MTELPEELRNRPARKPGHAPTATLTVEAYLRLKTELDELTSTGRDEIAERLKKAREHGDIRENAEYDAAKDAQGLMEARLRNLKQMLRDPEIVEAPVAADAVGPGVVVTIRPLDEDEPEDETYCSPSTPRRRSRERERSRPRPRSVRRCSAPSPARRSSTRRPAVISVTSWSGSSRIGLTLRAS